jgi:hypothetical protein
VRPVVDFPDLILHLRGSILMKNWNKQVSDYIRKHGTYTSEDKQTRRIFHIELDGDFYNDSGRKVVGYCGWWDDDHSVTHHARTPYEVYCDMM